MTQYQVTYNIPRVQVQMPGKQNRLTDTVLRITPGMTEPFEFLFGNQDGVPLSLRGFSVKLIFWLKTALDDNATRMGQSEIVLAKKFDIPDPYARRAEVVLTDEDTLKLGLARSIGLRWSLFLINEEGDVFPLQVTRRGGRYGNVQLDLDSGIPPAELVRSA
jgi:hypothetical protein